MDDRSPLLGNRGQRFLSSHWVDLVALLAFLLSAYLISASFSPNLNEIGSWDEASYVHAGLLRFEGAWASVADNPLVGLVYAIIYVPYAQSEFWLVHVTSVGRMVMFTLVWLSAYAVGRQLARWAHPLIMVGLLMVSSIPLVLFKFPSDPLFVAMAGFSFWKLLAFHHGGKLRDLALSSLFLGLAALSRNDGLIMGPVLVLLGAVIARGRLAVWRAILASAGPFVVVVFGYLLVSGSVTGNYRLGTDERAYDNFETGQGTVSTDEALGGELGAKLEARRLFGTPEENNYSIFRAIARNPRAYLERLLGTVAALPKLLLGAYGQRIAALTLLLAIRGGWELWRQKERRLLLLFLLWPAHLASGFAITLFRLGHLRFPFYVVYGMAAIGLTALIAQRKDLRERWGWTGLVLALVVLSTAIGATAVQMGALVFGAALVIVFWVWPAIEKGQERAFVPALGLLFLGVGLLLHGDFAGPGRRTLGENPDEQAVVFLQRNFARGTPIAAGSPGPIYAARMAYVGLYALDFPRDLPSAEFIEWLRDGGVGAIYVDHSLALNSPELLTKILDGVGSSLDRVFVAGDGDYQVLVFRE